MIRITTFRARAQQAYDSVRSRPSLFARVALGCGLVVILALGLIVLVPLLLLGAVGAAFLVVTTWLRRFFVRAEQPNGMLDGRRNVRVISPEDQGPDAGP